MLRGNPLISLKSAFTDPRYYLDALLKPFSRNLLTFFLFELLLSLILILHAAIITASQVKQTLTGLSSSIQHDFPSDLKLNWSVPEFQLLSSQAGTSYSQDLLPIKFRVPTETPLQWLAKYKYLFYLVADDNQNTLDRFGTDSVFLLVSPTTLYFRTSDNLWMGYPLEFFMTSESLSVDSTSLANYLDKASASLKDITDVLVLVSVLYFPLSLFVSYFLLALFESLILAVLLSLLSIKLKFSQLLGFSLVLSVLVSYIVEISKLLFPVAPPLSSSIVFWVLFMYLLLSQRTLLGMILSQHLNRNSQQR